MINLSKIPPLVGICIGLIIYELRPLCYLFISPRILPSVVNLLGLIVVFYYLSKAKYRPLGSMPSIYGIFILWTLIMIFRGSLIGNFPLAFGGTLTGIISSFLYNPYSGAAYLIPLIALISLNLNSLYYIKRLSVYLCLFFIIMAFFERDQIIIGQFTNGTTTLIGVNGEYLTVRGLIGLLSPGFGIVVFALFCSGYFKERIFSYMHLVMMIVYFIGQAIGGGRGATTSGFLYILSYFIITTRYPVSYGQSLKDVTRSKNAKRLSNVMLALGFVVLVVYLFNQTSVFDFVFERAFGGKNIAGASLDTSNRDVIKEDFIDDFNQTPTDWIWGRGVNGYYHTTDMIASSSGTRDAMEWGYLYLILKGGVIYLILTVLCFLHAAILGLKRSRNTLSKAMAFICLFHLYNMTSVAVQPNYSVRYLFPWLCVGLLELKQIRMMSDVDIYGYFNIKNYQPIT